MKRLNNDKVLMIMSNANGWRNPKVHGGAEFKTTSIISKISEINWIIIMPMQLFDIFSFKFKMDHLEFIPITTLFKKTGILKDIIQGLVYSWSCIKIGWRRRKEYKLIYSATTNFSDIFPAKVISLITKKQYIVKYNISIYDEPKVARIYRNFREEKNLVLDSFLRALLAKTTIYILKRAKRVLVVCGYLGTQLEKCGVEKNKIKVNYNGLDFIEMGKYKNNKISKEYDLCYIGRVEKNKGIIDIVIAVQHLIKSKPDLKAVIVGDGSYLAELKKEISQRHLERNIYTLGFLGDERYEVLQQSRIFVSPSCAKEGFGLTLLESLFFNVPILAYTQPVFEEVFGKYASVCLIESNQKLLEENIVKMLESRGANYNSDIDLYSLSNCAKRERLILEELKIL